MVYQKYALAVFCFPSLLSIYYSLVLKSFSQPIKENKNIIWFMRHHTHWVVNVNSLQRIHSWKIFEKSFILAVWIKNSSARTRG